MVLDTVTKIEVERARLVKIALQRFPHTEVVRVVHHRIGNKGFGMARFDGAQGPGLIFGKGHFGQRQLLPHRSADT